MNCRFPRNGEPEAVARTPAHSGGVLAFRNRLGVAGVSKREHPCAMNRRLLLTLWVLSGGTLVGQAAADREPRFTNVLNVAVPRISTDRSVRYDYDIVYVRA